MKLFQILLWLINNGNTSLVSLTEQPGFSCENICGLQTPVYGICQINLNNGYLNDVNKTKYCEYPFIYNDYECICAPGYLLNGSFCIQIIQLLTFLDQQIFDNFLILTNNLQENISNIQNKLITAKNYIYDYVTSEISNLRLNISTMFEDVQYKQNQFELIVQNNMSSLKNETQDMHSNIAAHKLITDQLRFDLFTVNATLVSQIQQVNTNIQVVSNSQKLITDSLKTDLTSSTNSLQTQINSLNSNINSLQAQIYNINIVNSAQTTDITKLKDQQIQKLAICQLTQGPETGYCSDAKQCCQKCTDTLCSDYSIYYKQYYYCSGDVISDGKCGDFIRSE
ncbi:Hypothetical_protein [Hexamita inflata]|uniref:Hypothetical_protein n=1 Tax=Hexamita inflata TaxID=28002 RepID=A0AA86R1X6_9EUKA|nr:Hypothetical protein HINF_LOCUS55453 [Hexamita inflata]